MDIYKETFDVWNKLASLYQDKFMNLDLYNDSYDFFCNALEKTGLNILEIGCGPDNITRYLLKQKPNLSIFGIDVAENMIELAKRNNPTASFKVMDCRQIDNLKTKFDGIVCGFCLPYLTDADSAKLISDCRNLLSPKGVIYLSFVEGDKSQSGYQVASNGDRVYFHYHNTDNIQQLLLDNEFEKPVAFRVNYKRDNGNMEVHTILVTKERST